jgi:hypothetical protein
MEAGATVAPADKSLPDAPACVRLLHAIGADQTDVKRRELLFELTLVLGGAPALDFLRVPQGPGWLAFRLDLIRGFATYRHTIDPATQIPPRGLLPGRTRRAVPYL